MRTTDDNPTLRHLRALLSGQPAKDPVKAQLVAEIKALNEYGARRFGDEWWPGQDPEFIAALSAAKEPTP